jgi:hypothetical protein
MNRSGKSELIRYLFSLAQVPRVLVDPKGEWTIPGVPRHTLRATFPAAADAEVAAIDWTADVVHVKPAWLGQSSSSPARAQLSALYDRIMRVPGELLVWTDEGYGVSSASWAPPGLLELQVAGAGMGKGHFVATQRPRNVSRELLTEADHLWLFSPLDADDIDAARRGFPFLTQTKALELMGSLEPHGFLWADRREKRLAVCSPLTTAEMTLGAARKIA